MPKPAPRSQRSHPSRSIPVANARDAAYRHLSAHAKRFPDLLPAEIQTGDLDTRDAALAHAIVDAAVRRWRTLEFVLETVSGHRSFELEPRMRGVLLGGAAQLLLLDRVPPHAVLDESVSWAKRHIRSGAGGMVNAVLRKVAQLRAEHLPENWDHHTNTIPLSEGGSLALRGVELPEHGRRRLGVACSLPDALLRRWESHAPDPTHLAMHTLCKPPTIVCVRHATKPETIEGLCAHESVDHRIFDGTRQKLQELLAAHPDLWVQDPASTATLAGLRADEPPERVIDLCAGQGTKTRQLHSMFPNAQILACEVDSARLQALKQQFGGSDQIRVVPVRSLDERSAAWASLVLADVPCSNTGVLARRVEARVRPIDRQLRRLVETQREIIAHAEALLAPGGVLVYATCSIEIEENEAQVQWASAELGLDLIELQRVEPRGLPGEPARVYRDASFAAYLRKP